MPKDLPPAPPAARRVARDRQRRRFGRLPGPRQREGPVGLPVRWQVRVEQHLPGGRDLREVAGLAPAHHPISAGQGLHVALAAGDERVLMLVAAHERRRPGGRVEREFDRARLRVHRRERAVVEERDRAIGLLARVVLPGRVGTWAQLEARVPAAQLPAHLPRFRIDVVRGPGVARVHQQVAVLLRVDRVDVEVVERFALARRRGRRVGVRQGHVVEAVPLVHDETRLQVDLLQQRVRDGAVPGSANRGQVAVDRVVDRDPGGPLRGDLEFVQIGLVAVAGTDDGDGLIGAVRDHLARRLGPVGDQGVLPPGERGLAFVFLHAKVRGARAGGRQRLEPDQFSVNVEDHRPVLTDSGIGSKNRSPPVAVCAFAETVTSGGRSSGRERKL